MNTNLNYYKLHKDAFSSGQIGSKIWLCEELEKAGVSSQETAIYGGWYGLLGFLLLSRGRFQVEIIRSYDIDPSCESIADMLNENWVYKGWKFKAFTEDCNTLITGADLIINTSTEHFHSMNWWENISKGKIVVLQSNNMEHDDHYMCHKNLNDFSESFPMTELIYEGQLDFNYQTWGFSRFMKIGIK